MGDADEQRAGGSDDDGQRHQCIVGWLLITTIVDGLCFIIKAHTVTAAADAPAPRRWR